MKDTLKTKSGPHLIVTEPDIISGARFASIFKSIILFLKACIYL